MINCDGEEFGIGPRQYRSKRKSINLNDQTITNPHDINIGKRIFLLNNKGIEGIIPRKQIQTTNQNSIEKKR